MDAALRERLYAFLAGQESKRDKTLYFMMQRFDRMAEWGFDYSLFLKDPESAQEEGNRFLLSLRERKRRQIQQAEAAGRPLNPRRRGTGARNYVINLKALARYAKFPEEKVSWVMPTPGHEQPDVYTLTELRALLRLPFRNTEERRLQRAFNEAHLALGWRLGEHVFLEDSDVDAPEHRVHLTHPEKGNPVRWLPIEPEFFSEHRAFGSWLKHRPVLKSNPRAVWVYTGEGGVVKQCTEQKLAELLREAGKLQGVRANCNRGRHTRCAALLAQRKQLAFVKFFMGHRSIATLTSYIEMVDMGLLKHLRKSSWFRSAQGGAPDDEEAVQQ